MVPDLDLQLQVVIKALKETVMPAVDPAYRVAMEQLGLSIATLSMVRERLPFDGLRERQALANAIALGRSAIASAPSEDIALAVRDGESLLADAHVAPGDRPAATRAILALVSQAVRASDEANAPALMRAVVEASRPALDLTRAWGKSAGFEPDPHNVPDLAALLTRTPESKGAA